MKRAYKILALDDEKFNLTIIEACLKGNDFEVVTFTDPLPAIKSCRENSYDLLLLDIMLGSISGFEVRKLIREFNPRVPIIFLTALVDDFDQSLFTHIYEDYYSYYMNKSFNKDIFVKKIIDLADEYRKVLETKKFYQQIQNDLHMAGEVQKIMLPLWSYHERNFAASYIYQPCIEVSGDVFRYLEMSDDRIFLMLGDISGHGVKSALTMSALQSFIRTMMTEEYKNNLLPHDILNHMNSFFYGDLAKVHYMTCLVGFMDLQNNKLIYQSAGHPDPLFFSIAQQRLLPINPNKAGNLPVGLDGNTIYQANDNIELSFQDNDIFLFYTDGF
ncbi:MAG: SpoIIE family protein phosphatase, partial [Victivallaceae bacterium]